MNERWNLSEAQDQVKRVLYIPFGERINLIRSCKCGNKYVFGTPDVSYILLEWIFIFYLHQMLYLFIYAVLVTFALGNDFGIGMKAVFFSAMYDEFFFKVWCLTVTVFCLLFEPSPHSQLPRIVLITFCYDHHLSKKRYLV